MEKNNIPLTPQKRLEFKKLLQQGDIKSIADIAEVNRVTVRRWFNHETDNPTIQKTVIELFRKRSVRISKTIDQIIGENNEQQLTKQA